MSAPARSSFPRYRGRILVAGLIAAGALYSFGAPMYVGRIEDDLEQRVPDELAQAGFAGIAAEFSGQDGTLRCGQPLDDPEAANAAAYDVWGVHKITLDRTCRVNTAVDGVDPADSSEESSETSSATAEAATVVALIANDPRLSYLSMLLDESGLAAHLDDSAAVTVFAPTDDAFETLPADAIAQLRSDPDLLNQVLGEHVAMGSVLAADLVPGPLEMADGSTLDVVVDGDTITIGGATVLDADLLAGNGVVHVIDAVLIPAGIDLSELESSA